MLEKVAILDDKEEIARLAEEAKGRKFFLRNISHYLSFLLPVQSCALRDAVEKCDFKEECANPPFLFRARCFLGEFWRNQRHS